MSDYLIDKISNQAKESWNPTQDYMYSEWEAHWFGVAEKLYDELHEQNLTKSAEFVREWININRGYTERRKANNEDFLVDYKTGKVKRAEEV